MTWQEIRALKDLIPKESYEKLIGLHFSHRSMCRVIYKHNLQDEYVETQKKRLDAFKQERERRNNEKASECTKDSLSIGN